MQGQGLLGYIHQYIIQFLHQKHIPYHHKQSHFLSLDLIHSTYITTKTQINFKTQLWKQKQIILHNNSTILITLTLPSYQDTFQWDILLNNSIQGFALILIEDQELPLEYLAEITKQIRQQIFDALEEEYNNLVNLYKPLLEGNSKGCVGMMQLRNRLSYIQEPRVQMVGGVKKVKVQERCRGKQQKSRVSVQQVQRNEYICRQGKKEYLRMLKEDQVYQKLV